MKKHRYQIMMTNDDGIQSPGLLAAAESLSHLGYVTVAAPREQSSSTGRSIPVTTDGKIEPSVMRVGGQDWTVYAIGGTPAQTVVHGVEEIMPEMPDLVVSGINYGENVGNGITISGTIGAALQAASFGVKAIAVSLQLTTVSYLSHSDQVDFSTAAYFTRFFAEKMLNNELPDDVDVLKIEVPELATPETPWQITRLAKHCYYRPFVPRVNSNWGERTVIKYEINVDSEQIVKGTDIYALIYDHQVSVTPLSLDMTSRIDLDKLGDLFKK